jgi:adenine C2-methylase RlmN of 23S rRNA A2503 and tRNA A37
LPKRFWEFLNNIACNDAADDGKNNNSHDSDASTSPSSAPLMLTSTVHSVQHSANTLTTKLIIQLHDGMLIESVIMRYDKKTTIPRASLCVSSQVGCAMACTFCATGTMGKIGNLGVAEILEQVIHANRILQTEAGRPSVRNVVFMGMGEVRLRLLVMDGY